MKSRGDTKYRRRDRDFDFMGWVRRQPCVCRTLPPPDFIRDLALRLAAPEIARSTTCSGHMEADHAGVRGLGQKASDTTCIPLCSAHHKQRTDHNGAFRNLTRDEARAWRAAAIDHTQAAWAAWSRNQ